MLIKKVTCDGRPSFEWAQIAGEERPRQSWCYMLKVIYHPLYGMNKYVLIWGEGHMIVNHTIYGVIGYHVILSEGHMIANHPI